MLLAAICLLVFPVGFFLGMWLTKLCRRRPQPTQQQFVQGQIGFAAIKAVYERD